MILHVVPTLIVTCQARVELTCLTIIHVPCWRGQPMEEEQDTSGLTCVLSVATVEIPTTLCLGGTVRSELLRTLTLFRGNSISVSIYSIFHLFRIQKSHLDNMNRNRNLQKQVSIEQARQIARQGSDGHERYSGEWSRGDSGARNGR